MDLNQMISLKNKTSFRWKPYPGDAILESTSMSYEEPGSSIYTYTCNTCIEEFDEFKSLNWSKKYTNDRCEKCWKKIFLVRFFPLCCVGIICDF
jgi:DNA-directed RNA polymerase subunit RPC12/RpoP